MKGKFPLFALALSALSFQLAAQVQKINTVAGSGIQGFSGDGGAAPAATLNGPLSVTVDSAGNFFIADVFNNRVRKVNTAGLIFSIAGNGLEGNTGNGTIGTSAPISPYGVAADRRGNVYMSDVNTNVVRRVNAAGIISAVAGTGTAGYTGDGGNATNARLNRPYGIAVDIKGNLYIADAGNHAVRKVDTFGKITTIAGFGLSGYSGDGLPAMAAALDSPYAIAADRAGNIFINDFGNNVIRVIGTDNNISTFAGTGAYNYTGDGGMATLATLNAPRGIATDTAGNLYIADAYNNVVRKVTTGGIISTVAGNGTVGFGGDLGLAGSANLRNPYGVAVDRWGSIYIADANNQRVRKTYNPALGIGSSSTDAQLHVYPNPANNTISVSGLTTGDNIAVLDVSGKQVIPFFKVSGATQTLNVNALPAGNFVINVTNYLTGKSVSTKLVKE